MLARAGKELFVEEGQTILDAVLDLGISVPYSCMEGNCGECATKVLEGIPDHRDDYFSEEEHASNERMTICCSRAKSERLVLDI